MLILPVIFSGRNSIRFWTKNKVQSQRVGKILGNRCINPCPLLRDNNKYIGKLNTWVLYRNMNVITYDAR